MSQEEQDRLKGSIKGDTARAERLAAELRRNLNRRKQRSRAVAARAQESDRVPPAPRSDDPSQ